MLSALLSLSGCASELYVNNPSPRPYYPTCETIKALARCDQPKSMLSDFVGMTNVMDKLRSREPENERDRFIRCEFAIPKCPAGK